MGVVMAIWGARMPAVQLAAHLTTAQLALVLLAAALGMVAGLKFGGRLALPERLPTLLTGGAVGLAGCLALLGQCHSLASLLAAALAFGATHGVLDVAANAAAVRCQNAYGRSIMSGFHAAYSLGALGGAALTAATARTGHTSLFLVTGLAVAVVALGAAPATQTLNGADQPTTPTRRGAADRRPPLSPAKLWLLGALAAGSLLSGDRLHTVFGAPAVVRAGAVLAAAGLATGVLAGSVPWALAGWAVFGLGLSTTVPSLITAAGAGGPSAVATVAVIGYVGLLAGPALIGALASVTALSAALLLPALLAATVAGLSHRALENTAPCPPPRTPVPTP
ncbi:MFS transporter [Streptomyces inhibens]|uniref:MFS transporter n=1 Tax=Streptomyces inhibens TaxID=2293571 RepID=UPI00402AEABD